MCSVVLEEKPQHSTQQLITRKTKVSFFFFFVNFFVQQKMPSRGSVASKNKNTKTRKHKKIKKQPILPNSFFEKKQLFIFILHTN